MYNRYEYFDLDIFLVPSPYDLSCWWDVKLQINENMFLESEAPKLLELLLVSKSGTEN